MTIWNSPCIARLAGFSLPQPLICRPAVLLSHTFCESCRKRTVLEHPHEGMPRLHPRCRWGRCFNTRRQPFSGTAREASRVIPRFPELLPYLEKTLDQAEPGAVYVVSRYRGTNSNLRTQLERIIKRASVSKWSRLFQNLRASRQTELENEFPSHVVCTWMGNSESFARRHYLQVTDAHFRKAVDGGATVGAEVVQKPGAASCRVVSHRIARSKQSPRKTGCFAA